jgi:hypothetical protein
MGNQGDNVLFGGSGAATKQVFCCDIPSQPWGDRISFCIA